MVQQSYDALVWINNHIAKILLLFRVVWVDFFLVVILKIKIKVFLRSYNRG